MQTNIDEPELIISAEWKIGVVSQITSSMLTVEGHVNEFRDRIFEAIPHHFASVNQYIYTFHGRYQIHVFKVVEISHNEKPYGKAETDKSNEFIKIRAIPFGTFDTLGFTLGVRDYPMVGDYVYAANDDILTKIFASKNTEVSLGSLVGFSNVQAVTSVDSLFAGHSGVFGNTGSGKSTTTRHLLSQMVQLYRDKKSLEDESRIVVVDVHGDYSFLEAEYPDDVTIIKGDRVCLAPNELTDEDWFAALLPSEGVQRPLLERALQYARISEENRKFLYAAFAYNALYNSNHESHSSRKIQLSKFLNLISDKIDLSGKFGGVTVKDTPEFLRKVFNLRYGNLPEGAFEKLQNELVLYLNDFFDHGKLNIEKIINDSRNDKEFSSLKKLDDALDLVFAEEEVLGNRQARHHSQGLVTRLKNLVSKHDGSLITTTPSMLSTILDCRGVVIVDVQNISDDEGLALITNSLARKILNNQRESFKKTQEHSLFSPVTLVLDEAHRYIRGDVDNPDSIFDRIAREGRKFGTYLFFISQIPSELSRVVIGQATAFLLHRIQNSYDLEFLRRNLPGVSEVEISKLPLFASGQAIVTGAAIQTPMEVLIPGDYKDVTPSVSFMK
ncbi:ATP-binding protein [Corynebacterium mendelii]|uniref:ATP-binding protein n=1 Tax=Corynebacterium mendelii TaxID=2765362 RepID=A0A939DZF5_9CORY|nr:ATP-binding protein [Corynebacterium mendelii]MBN9643649.1 ATP-binding protein [Corynebacterium mendelii]